MDITSDSIRNRLWRAAGALLGFTEDELSADLLNLPDGVFTDIASAAMLTAVSRHVLAIESIAETLASVLVEQKKQTTYLERIAVSNERQWECCRNSAERTEALLQISLTHPDATPQERYAMYESILTGGSHA